MNINLLIKNKIVLLKLSLDDSLNIDLGKRIDVQTVFVQIIGFYRIQNNAQRTPLQCKTKTNLESIYRTTKYI